MTDSATLLNSNGVQEVKSSFGSNQSPFRDHFQTSFDFNSELNTDLNEFNDFFIKAADQYNQIERPQNPFHKNFESYKQTKKSVMRNSFSELESASLLADEGLRKTPST